MKILALLADKGACGFHRMLEPLCELSRNTGWDISIRTDISRELIYNRYDVVICQRQYNKQVYEIVKEMKHKGSKIVYEQDDLIWNIPEWFRNVPYRNHEVMDDVDRFVDMCDMIWTTTEPIAYEYRKKHHNVVIIPNSLNLSLLPKISRMNNVYEKPSVMWTGSYSRQTDVDILKSAFSEISKMGIARLFIFGDSHLSSATCIQPVPTEEYYQKLSTIPPDIGLCPLTTHPFNAAKSNLKWLEYSWCGAATIASDFGPYRDSIQHMKTGYLVKDPNKWKDSIIELIQDVTLRKKLAVNALREIKKNHDLHKNWKLWSDALISVCHQAK
jgi:glycosyltransferase involved in cell wall biosynthesis